MTFRELMAHLRCSVLRDTASPTLWADAELRAFLNEAQDNFARRTFCLIDDSSDFTSIDVAAGQAQYPLDKRVLFINWLGLAEYDEADALTRWEQLQNGTRHRVPRTHYIDRPALYTAQTATRTLTLYPVPDAAYTLEMQVARLPLAPLESPDDECEIPEDYSLALCDYAAWRALKNNSPEGAQMVPATEFRAAYDLVVRDAKRDLASLHRGAGAQARGNWTGKHRRGLL